MSISFEIFRWTTLGLFLGMCVLSYFSGKLFAWTYDKIRRVSWERADLPTKAVYWGVRSYREYLAPGENLPDPRDDAQKHDPVFVQSV